MNTSRVVKAGLAPGTAAAVIFLFISALVWTLDVTRVIEGVLLGLVAGVVSLLIATVIAASSRRRADPPAAGSR
jgi:hypothetical protein